MPKSWPLPHGIKGAPLFKDHGMIVSKCCKAEIYPVWTTCHDYFVCCKCARPSATIIVRSLVTEGVYDTRNESSVATSTYYS